MLAHARYLSLYYLHLCFFSLVICLPIDLVRSSAFAEDEEIDVFVTANKYPTEWRDLSASTSVIEESDIEEYHTDDAAELLSSIPGIDIVRSGPQGGNTAAFLRGANSEHTLVLLDGIELNNPISNAKFFNLGDFSLDGIERIEVVRGPQGVLYGSEAIGGVIQFFSAVPKKPFEASTRLEVGSYDLISAAGTVAGKNPFFNYSATLSHKESSGISSAGKRYGNKEDDGFRFTGFTGRFQATPEQGTELNLTSRISYSDSDLDQFGGAYGDDPNRRLENENIFLRGEFKREFFEKVWIPSLAVSLADHTLDDDDDPDQNSTLFQRSKYQGSSIQMAFNNELKLSEATKAILGVEQERERGSSEYLLEDPTFTYSEELDPKRTYSTSAFAHVTHRLTESLVPSAGVRYDSHQGFSDETSWQSGLAWTLEPAISKLTFNYGTGFKAPSLFQRYSIYGNEDLNAETSRGYDIGAERYFSDVDSTIKVSYFHNQIDNMISFDPNSFKFYGVGEARTEGIETSLLWAPSTIFDVEFNYTLLKTWDADAADELLRRAPHRATIAARLAIDDKTTIRGILRYVGSREDNDFSTVPSTRTTLDSYVTADLVTQYAVDPSTIVYLRFENLFDEEYEDVYGYGTPGASALIGIKKSFDGV